MLAHEIIRALPEEKVIEMILYVRENEMDSYRAVLFSLAEARRIRPAFVQKKHRNEQAKWIHQGLCNKKQAQYAEHFLQILLMKGHQPMLVDFLDKLEIPHDGEGGLESFPEELDAAKLKSAADSLLEKYENDDVALYLNTFQLQIPDGYPALTEYIANEPRLQITSSERDPEDLQVKKAPETKKSEATESKTAAE